MESKQILSILQEKTRSSMQHTSSRDEESVRERPQVPSAVSHHQHHHHQNQFQQQQQNQPFANRVEQMSLPSPSSLTSAMYRGEEEKNRFDPRTPSDTVPPSFRHVSESRLQRSAAAPPPPSHPGNQFESMQQQSTVRDARHQMLLDNFVPGPFAGQESGPRHTFQQQQRQQVQQEQQLQHQQMRQRQQMQHFRSAQPSQDLSSFSSSPHQQQHHHQQQQHQQQQQQQNPFPSSISPSNRQMNSFRQDNSNTFKSRSPRQQSGQGHQFQQFQQSQLERATQQFSLQQQQQQQQQREGPLMHHPQNPDSYAAYQLQQQQQFAEFASNRQALNDPVNVAMLMQQQRERERAAQQFSEMNQVAEEHNGPAPDSYEAWLARK